MLACDTGRASCNTSTVDGCETTVSTSTTHCGACGVACPTLPNSTPSCAGGECRSACASASFADCNGQLTDGCETNVGTDARNCGACGRVCGPSETCVSSACSCSGAFTALTPPTPRNSTRLNERTFDYGLTCGIARTSVATVRVTVVGHGAGRQSGTFALVNPNLTRWTADAPLLGGDGVDITVGAGLRSVDNLRAAPYRVIQGRVATSSGGSGTFAPGWTATSTVYGWGVALGDVDGDGDLDLITNEGLRLNAGSGTFGDVQAVVLSSAVQVWAHDFNADGFADVYVESSDITPRARVLWGAATNPLRTGTNLGLPYRASPGFGDIDGDGDIDIVAGRSNGSREMSSVHRLDTSVSPPTFSNVGSVGPSDYTYQVRLLDVDGDGDLDIFQGNYGLERVLLNDGTGTFALTSATTGMNTTHVRGMAVGDINGDSFADVVMSHVVEFATGTDTDQILLGNGSGGFTTATGLNSAGPTELADIDGDGDLDVITRVGTRLGVYVNNGTGTFTGGATAFASTNFAVGDIDGDGDVDIVNFDNTTLTAYRNACAGSTCTCGNRVVNGREQCDDGAMGSASCDTDCTLRACGDGVVNMLAGETCDDGNTVDDDACRATCVTATCTDRARNRDETDVDCGGSCTTKCTGGQACRVGADCQSGRCFGFRCGTRIDFESGTFPPTGMSTSGAANWQVDAMYPIAQSRRSAISGQFPFSSSTAERTSSLFLAASYAVAGSIQFTRGTNTLAPNRLEFYIDGVRQMTWAGQRMVPTDPDFGVTQFYNVASGTHTFEWRFVYGPDSTTLPAAPRDRGWIDDIGLIGGASTP